MAGTGPLENDSTRSGVPTIRSWRPAGRTPYGGWFPGACAGSDRMLASVFEVASWGEWAAFRDRRATGFTGRHDLLVRPASR